MKIFKNAAISVLTLIAAVALYIPYLIIYSHVFEAEDFTFGLVASYLCFALLLLFISGRLFIKSGAKKKENVISFGISGIIIFIFVGSYYVYSSINDTGGPFQSPNSNLMGSLGTLVFPLAVIFICSFLPPLIIWFGMFSKNKNRRI